MHNSQKVITLSLTYTFESIDLDRKNKLPPKYGRYAWLQAGWYIGVVVLWLHIERSKGLRGIIRSFDVHRKCIDALKKLQLTAEQNQILTRCSRICNVGTIWPFMSSFFCILGTYIRTSTLIMQGFECPFILSHFVIQSSIVSKPNDIFLRC